MASARQQGRYDVIIVGAGPAGIFAALEFVRAAEGPVKMIIVEKGSDLDARVCPSNEGKTACRRCQPCSIVSGWGGAGAFSDGKLTLSTQVGGMLDVYLGDRDLKELIEYVDGIYLGFGAPTKVYGGDEEALHELERKALIAELKFIPAKIRHLGTGKTKDVLEGMKNHLAEQIEISLRESATKILVEDGKVAGIETSKGRTILGDYVIVAPGREGAEWLAQEARRLGLSMAINPVDIGVRVELPAVVAEPLTDVAYESKLIYHSRSFDDKVRTFCMCPYGEVVTESSDGLITVNGHTHFERKTENTNFALLVSKTFTEPFKDPIAYGKYVAGLANLLGGGVIVQRLGDLITGRRSTRERLAKGTCVPTLEDATPGDLSLVFPYRHLVSIIEMLKSLDAVAPGVYGRNTLLYGVEVKFYSSRLAVTSSLETQIRNLFAIGDGAGVTRGLMQASASGVVAAREILGRLARP
ncbi:MAG: NAD(P)/FAD-dependent oxidoreductase [Firmicutes bacterium]|nr:NAD(P)/FAD-dependent oxidoreductase [Bacillota bacterium]MDH7494347.1 NAD(P)/FAD-dependent oxidoreductase [Bacillota bacterium]